MTDNRWDWLWRGVLIAGALVLVAYSMGLLGCITGER